jgi:hypothetical protein
VNPLDVLAKSDCHFDISGATSVLPAPVSVPDEPPELLPFEELPQAATAKAAASAAKTLKIFLLNRDSFVDWFRPALTAFDEPGPVIARPACQRPDCSLLPACSADVKKM